MLKLCVFLVVLLLQIGGGYAACSDFRNDCTQCTRASENGVSCRYCMTDGGFCQRTNENCALADRISVDYDCPVPPRNGFDFNDNFARGKALSAMKATTRDDPRACLQSLMGANVTATYKVRCDRFRDDCFGYTAVSPSDLAIIVAFRGTNGFIQLVTEGAQTIFREMVAFPAGGKVDAYFYEAFQSIWNAGMRTEVQRLKGLFPNHQLWVFGHSLGGAMASLCSATVLNDRTFTSQQVRLVTFGQPRTGDVDYARVHSDLHYYSYRVIHNRDIVPHLPERLAILHSPLHHRYEVWYPNDMTPGANYTLCTRADDLSCSNRVVAQSIEDHGRYYNQPVSC